VNIVVNRALIEGIYNKLVNEEDALIPDTGDRMRMEIIRANMSRADRCIIRGADDRVRRLVRRVRYARHGSQKLSFHADHPMRTSVAAAAQNAGWP